MTQDVVAIGLKHPHMVGPAAGGVVPGAPEVHGGVGVVAESDELPCLAGSRDRSGAVPPVG